MEFNLEVIYINKGVTFVDPKVVCSAASHRNNTSVTTYCNYHPTTLRNIKLLEIASWNDLERGTLSKSKQYSLDRGGSKLSSPHTDD
jgi:hypothetical protein